MNIESPSNKSIQSSEATAFSDNKLKTKSGIISLDLGDLKVISEHVQTSSATSIFKTEFEESSKSLRGTPTLSEQDSEFSSEEIYDSELEDFGDFDQEAEDLLNDIFEEEGFLNLEEERAEIKEERAEIEEETVEIEGKTASIEQVDSEYENELENQRINEGSQVDREAKSELHQGVESSNQLNTEITVVDTGITGTKESIAVIDTSVAQNETAIEKKSTAITKAKIGRAEYSTKLNELHSQKRIDQASIKEAIQHRLQHGEFRNLCNGKGDPLHQDLEAQAILAKNIEDDLQAHPDKSPTQAIEDQTKAWLKSQNVQERTPEGDLVSLTPERVRALSAHLSRGVIKYIVIQTVQAQKIAEKNKTEEKHQDSLKMGSRVENESIVYPVDGQNLDPRFFGTLCKVVECMLHCFEGIDIRNVKRLDELSREIIDVIDRVKQMIILKDIIKKEILKTEIEHIETKRSATVINGVKRGILNKIFRSEGPSQENVCLRHPTLHPRVKAE